MITVCIICTIIKKNDFISTKIDLKEVCIIIKNNIFVQSKMNDTIRQ